jgi:anaphase-promoting complex subunit 8
LIQLPHRYNPKVCRGKTEKARNVLTESVRLYPCNWSTWKALNAVCSEWEDVISLNLPEHFMREMFLAVMCLDLHWCGEALSRMEELSESFPRSRFLILKAACAHYNSRKMDEAQACSLLAECVGAER